MTPPRYLTGLKRNCTSMFLLGGGGWNTPGMVESTHHPFVFGVPAVMIVLVVALGSGATLPVQRRKRCLAVSSVSPSVWGVSRQRMRAGSGRVAHSLSVVREPACFLVMEICEAPREHSRHTLRFGVSGGDDLLDVTGFR